MPRPNDDLVAQLQEVVLTLHHDSQRPAKFDAALLGVADSLLSPSPGQPELQWLYRALRERWED